MDKALIKYIDSVMGIPYLINGRDHDGIDCFGMCVAFYDAFLKTDPDGLCSTLPKGWEKSPDFEEFKQGLLKDRGEFIDAPELYCIVLMSPREKDKVEHIGIYLGEDKVLNTNLDTGIIISRLSLLKKGGRVRGYLRLHERRRQKTTA